MRCLLLCALIACGGSSSTTPEAPKQRVGDLGVDIANLTAQLPPYIDSLGAADPKRAFAGYVLVAQHDQVLWSGAYGMADRAKQQVPTAQTSFRTGSVTKQFTATAILKLEQDGKLSVDDTVGKHLP
jgi:D-alanyl-D-alanine carboxypeptidase